MIYRLIILIFIILYLIYIITVICHCLNLFKITYRRIDLLPALIRLYVILNKFKQ